MTAFLAEFITPDKVFLSQEILRLCLNLPDGAVEILAGHMPSIAEISAGECEITFTDNTRRKFYSKDGILNIGREKTIITSDFLEWEEDVEAVLLELEAQIALERARRQQSFREYRLGDVTLERLFANLTRNKDNANRP